jgi:O-antigen/teichoic acid export membrane protein
LQSAAETATALNNAPAFSFKKLFHDILVYSSGNILIKSMSLISAPIFTRIFSTDEYGAWSYITPLVSLITGFLILGGEEAYARFFFECKTDDERMVLTSTWFIFLTAWSIVFILALLPFNRQIVQLLFGNQHYHLAWTIGLLAAPPAMLNTVLAQALRNQFKARIFTVLNVTTALLTLVLSVFFALYFRLGIAGALVGAGSACLIMIPVRLWFIRDLLAWRFSAVQLKKILSFGLPLLPVILAFWIFSNADRVMLARMASLEEVGLYSIAVSMAAVPMLLHGALGQSWLPHALKLYETDREYARVVFGKTINYFLAGAGFIVLGFLALAGEVLHILVAEPYRASYAAIPALALGILFFITAQVTVVGILVKNKTVYILLTCWFIALLNIALNYLFIPLWGIVGAGAATGLSYLVFALCYAVVSARLFPIYYQWGNLFKLVLIILLSAGLIVLIAFTVPGFWCKAGLKVIVAVVAGAGFLWVILRSEKIRLSDLLKTGRLSIKKQAL